MVDKFAIVSVFGVFQGKLVLCVVQKTLKKKLDHFALTG